MHKPDKKQELLKRANKQIEESRKIEETINTLGWKDIIQPTIDNSIQGAIGGKRDSVWYGGKISDDKKEYWTGYAQGLMDLSNRIHAYKARVKALESKITELKSDSGEVKMPLEDTRYAKQ